MKVLHILNSLLPSGAETMLCCSARYWDKDLELHILATEDEIGTYAEALSNAGYIIHHIHEKNYWKQHRAVRAFIKKEKFDIVHIHRQSEAFSYALDARLSGVKKIIRTVHNVFVFHGLVQIREFITRQLSCLIGVQHVAIGPSVFQNEKKRFHVTCTLIPNWYDENRFFFTTSELKKNARKALKISENSFCIVSVGNCSPVKNHFAILRAIDKYKNCSCFSDLIYFHIGSGPQESEEKIYVKKSGISNYVMFCGFQDPVIFLQASDLFIMPSTHEGFSISSLEGAATGIRTILTDVPGLCDYKGLNLENVIYCKLGDEEVANAIFDQVLKGKEENSRLQSDTIRKQFGIQQGVNKYQKLYYD